MARTTMNGLAVSAGQELRPPKFMTLFLFMFEWSHESHFWGLFSKFLKNGKKFFFTISTSKGPPFGKKSKISKKNFFFFQKIILFLFEFVL